MNILLSLAGIRFDRGMGEYIRMFLPFLCKEFKKNLIVVSDRDVPNEIFNIIQNHGSLFYKKDIPYPIFEQLIIPKIIKEYKVKVAHFPANTFPLIKPRDVKFIVVIHDMMFLKKYKPKVLRQKIGKFYRAFIIKNGLKNIDVPIFVSNTTLNEFKKLMNNLGRTNDANVIYNPLNLCNDEKYDDSILRLLSINAGEYIYTISGSSPNKNFDFVLKSFSKLKSTYPNLKLVVSGIYKFDDIKLFKSKIESLNIRDSVVFTGYVTEAQKKSLIKNCKTFIFLSKEEGFGRPIIEALMENAVVIASDIEIFREIGDRFIYYIDINDENSLLNFFLNHDFNLHIHSKDKILNYLRSKFDVEINAKKLINLTYKALEGSESEF